MAPAPCSRAMYLKEDNWLFTEMGYTAIVRGKKWKCAKDYEKVYRCITEAFSRFEKDKKLISELIKSIKLEKS